MIARERSIPSAATRSPREIAVGSLTLAVAIVYLASAYAGRGAQPVLAAAEAAIGLALAACVVALLRRGGGAPLLWGLACAQLALAALWAVAHTVGLPGQPVPEVGSVDLLCVVDELALTVLALEAAHPAAAAPSGRGRGRGMAACQLAAALAAITLFVLGSGHAHPVHAGLAAWFGGHGGGAFFCHPL